MVEAESLDTLLAGVQEARELEIAIRLGLQEPPKESTSGIEVEATRYTLTTHSKTTRPGYDVNARGTGRSPLAKTTYQGTKGPFRRYG